MEIKPGIAVMLNSQYRMDTWYIETGLMTSCGVAP